METWIVVNIDIFYKIGLSINSPQPGDGNGVAIQRQPKQASVLSINSPQPGDGNTFLSEQMA